MTTLNPDYKIMHPYNARDDLTYSNRKLHRFKDIFSHFNTFFVMTRQILSSIFTCRVRREVNRF